MPGNTLQSPDVASFLPPERATPDMLASQFTAWQDNLSGRELLEAMPGPAMLVNENRQIVAANRLLLTELRAPSVATLLGDRPGEALGCIHSCESAGGCGTSEACRHCGAAQALKECLESGLRTCRECRIATWDGVQGGALDLRVHATRVELDSRAFIVIGLEDISAEKRLRVLERVFFHDILNLCGGLRGLAAELQSCADDPEFERECRRDIACLSAIVVDEIAAHRQMMEAERGELLPEQARVEVEALFRELGAAYAHHPAAEGKILRFEGGCPRPLRTDPVLLRRVLGNLLKNALEASNPGACVTVSCVPQPGGVRFEVHNAGVIPREIQLQIFQRSFSTKAGAGRGIGTYSVKLLGERYLRGKAGFTSREGSGTTFSITLPWELG